jgi:hypothetical protein
MVKSTIIASILCVSGSMAFGSEKPTQRQKSIE